MYCIEGSLSKSTVFRGGWEDMVEWEGTKYKFRALSDEARGRYQQLCVSGKEAVDE